MKIILVLKIVMILRIFLTKLKLLKIKTEQEKNDDLEKILLLINHQFFGKIKKF